MTEAQGQEGPAFAVWSPSERLSPRVRGLRDFYFQGCRRAWNNEVAPFTTGTDWDVVFNPLMYAVAPDVYFLLNAYKHSLREAARPVSLPAGFWELSIAERHAAFLREVMLNHLPADVLPGELVVGGRFNTALSKCLSKKEAKAHAKLVDEALERLFFINEVGVGNAGVTPGHLIPDYRRVLREGFRGIHEDLQRRLAALDPRDRDAPRKAAQLRAMSTAALMTRELAEKYARRAEQLAEAERNPDRREELLQVAANCRKVPWEPAETFWQAVQSLWFAHMLVMADESYPGPGVSFGRVDQYLWPYYQRDVLQAGAITREFAKEIWANFCVKCNFAYDYQIRVGNNQGINSGFGQLVTLGGINADGSDASNELTFLMLEVVEELNLLEPKPNVRLHAGTPDRLLDRVVEMVAKAQGAPFLLNFDERAVAGLRRAGLPEDRLWDYAPVGCLENTLQGDDRSHTVDVNLNLVKAVELALHDGVDTISGKRLGPRTGKPERFATWDQFWEAFETQLRSLVRLIIDVYDVSDRMRARFEPTPYLSCIVGGCAEKGLDVTQGGARFNFVTVEGVTFATCVDSLLAIKYLVYDSKACDVATLKAALAANWEGADYEKLRQMALNRAPKYGNDDPEADQMARKVMEVWALECTKHVTSTTGRRFRAGMLSWNYWVAYADVLPATPDGRKKGQFLSNAICPSNGADRQGPTANAKSVGTAMGDLLPNGASHTISFNPSVLRDPAHREKFKAFLRAYGQVGGSALQINVVDAEMLREAQKHPQEYRNLLVRVTGYNAYFVTVGKELQDEIIARVSHQI
ncbi:MAG: glycyl radical protein [Promethearchaeota archaeon]